MKKTIREILLEENRAWKPGMDRIRQKVLDKHYTPPRSESWRSRMGFMLPRWQWAALATVWMLLLVVHLATPTVSSPDDGSHEATCWHEHQELLGEVLRLMHEPSHTVEERSG